MKKPTSPVPLRPPAPGARYDLRLTVETPWPADKTATDLEESTKQVIAAVRHHLTKAKVKLIAIEAGAITHKRVVETLRGETLPPEQRHHTDSTSRPLDIDVGRDVGVIQLFIGQFGRWVEIANFTMPEESQ